MPPSRKELTKIACLWASLSILLHATYINTPFLNLEYLFKEAALTFFDPEAFPLGLSKYLRHQANPFGYAFVLEQLNTFLPLESTQWVARLPALMGMVMILISLAWIVPLQKTTHSIFHLLCGFCTLTPMIWTFSARASADILGAGLFFVSLAIAFHAKNKPGWLFLSTIMFSLSILTKYNMAVLGPGFVYLLYWDNKKKLNFTFMKRAFFFTLLPVMSLSLYLYWKLKTYGIFVYSTKEMSSMGLNISSFPSTFSQYSMYLMMMLMFIPFLSIFNTKVRLKDYRAMAFPVFLGIFLFILPLIVYQKGGEMNYGPLDSFIVGPLEYAVKLTAALLFSFFIYDTYLTARESKDHPIVLVFLCCAIPYFIVSSLTRPAQRYLIPILPMVAYLMTYYLESKVRPFLRPIVLSSLGIFVFLNTFSALYQVRMGSAVLKLVEQAREKKILHLTTPGDIAPHAEFMFWDWEKDLAPKPYDITLNPGPASQVLYRQPITVFGHLVRTYYIVKRN